MASTNHLPECRLCHSRLREPASGHGLCSVCDDYAQHIALETNRRFDRVVAELQTGVAFQAASRNVH